MIVFMVKPKLQLLFLVVFCWGDIMALDEKLVFHTSTPPVGADHNLTSVSQMITNSMVGNRQDTSSHQSFTQALNKSMAKEEIGVKFQRMPSVFLIELVLVLLSNLFTFMIRSYKNSIPLVKLNIIILLSYYIVEIANFVLICQVKLCSILIFTNGRTSS